MKPSEVLLAARELIAAPGGWTTGTYAVDKYGKSVHPCCVHVDGFCLLGATYRVDPLTSTQDILAGKVSFPGDWPSAKYLSRVISGHDLWQGTIGAFNDTRNRTQLEAVVALEKAALLAMEEGQ